MTTLHDVAVACNTSTATVSYVLNGRGEERRISPETQEIILNTAKELGYKKKSSKATPSKPKIAIYWPKKGLETTLISVINGLNSAILFDTVPVSISICPFESNNLSAEEDLWSSKVYNAAIIVSASAGDLATLSKRKTKIPVVIHNRILEGYPSVTTDQMTAGRLAAEQAICKAGDNIGLVMNSHPYLGLNQRATAVSKTCQEYGIDIYDKIFYCENNIESGYELGIRMILENKVPKAIICTYDIVGYGLMRAMVEANYKIGEDIHIINTCSSLPQIFSKSTPPMTVVDMKLEEVTQRAVRLAIELASHRIDLTNVPKIIVQPVITYRDSSPIPTRDDLDKLRRLKEKYADVQLHNN